MIKCSIAIMRDALAAAPSARSLNTKAHHPKPLAESVLREIASVRQKTPGFTGVISDLGGPTATCTDSRARPFAGGALPAAFVPFPQASVPTSTPITAPLIDLYRRARQAQAVKKITIGSGVRYDLALASPPTRRTGQTSCTSVALSIASPAALCQMLQAALPAFR